MFRIKFLHSTFCFLILLLSFRAIASVSDSNTFDNTNIKTIPEFSAQYIVLHKSDPVGHATRQLSYLNNGDIRYHYETDVNWFIFSQERKETSIVQINNNQVIPLHYTYSRTGTGRDKGYEWAYDSENKTATNLKKNKDITIDFSNNLQDKLSYHLQQRLDLIKDPTLRDYNYPVISASGKIKNYNYKYDGTEDLILPYGLVNAIRLKREVKEKKRITYAWFAPELNYLLVKIYQIKNGTEQFEAQLESINHKENIK